MNHASIWRLAMMVALGLLCLTGTASAALRDLQAHGSNDRLWLARVEPVTGTTTAAGDVTTLFVREKFEPKWKRLDPINTRFVALGNRGAQLAILFSNGDWRLTTDDGLTSGRPLPDGARMVTIGGVAGELWAVGLVPAPAGPATAPATQATITKTETPATSPSVEPSPATAPAAQNNPAPRFVLYRLGAQNWIAESELPRDIPTGDRVSLSIGSAGGLPVLAQKVDDRTIRLFRLAANKTWEPVTEVASSFDLQDFKVLDGTMYPVVWLRSVSGPGQLRMFKPGSPPVIRDLQKIPGHAAHAVAYANGEIRVLWVDEGKVFEQLIGSEGNLPEGEVSTLTLPAVSIVPAVRFWVQLTLSSALIFALAASMRRRQEMQDLLLDPGKLRLAPFSTRFTAGVIDAVPLLVASWFARSRQESGNDMGIVFTLAVGAAVYLLLTTLVEVIAGRSLGKLLTGLQVVGLDGKPAGVGARVMRNLLRIIDLPVMPLALVLFSPLRQRAGDLAAGTLVVRGKAKDETAQRAQDSTGRVEKDTDAG